MKPHFFVAEAELEVREAFEWYESRQPGLGIRYLDEVQSTVARVCRMPSAHSKVEGDIRRARVFGFPHFVYFEELETAVAVLSVFHYRRRPKSYM